jgi:hypothetical protein
MFVAQQMRPCGQHEVPQQRPALHVVEHGGVTQLPPPQYVFAVQ